MRCEKWKTVLKMIGESGQFTAAQKKKKANTAGSWRKWRWASIFQRHCSCGRDELAAYSCANAIELIKATVLVFRSARLFLSCSLPTVRTPRCLPVAVAFFFYFLKVVYMADVVASRPNATNWILLALGREFSSAEMDSNWVRTEMESWRTQSASHRRCGSRTEHRNLLRCVLLRIK